MRSQILSNLQDELDSPNAVANRTLAATLFPNHPYGRPVNGDLDSIKAITRDDLVAWATHHFGRDTMIVSVVGDVTPEQLKPLLDQPWARLPAQSDAVGVPDAQPAGGGTVKVIRRAVPAKRCRLRRAGREAQRPRLVHGAGHELHPRRRRVLVAADDRGAREARLGL